MEQKSLAMIFIIIFIIVLPASQPATVDTGELAVILKKTADYCLKLEESSFHYFCRERIREAIYSQESIRGRSYRGGRGPEPGQIDNFTAGEKYNFLAPSKTKKVKTSNSIYDYQLIKMNNRIEEVRKPLTEKTKANKKQKKLFELKKAVHGPLVFKKMSQKQYKYRIVKRKKVKGKSVVIIEAKPKVLNSKKLAGNFWIDESDFSIVRIDVFPSSMGNYKKLEKTVKALGYIPHFFIHQEYDVIKDGIRFPSKIVITEKYMGVRGGIYLRSRTTIRYDKYKFFKVKTKTKITG